MALRVFTGNRMEHLVTQLGELLDRPLSSPLAKETIVVQSKGMQRWLAMELARRNGVWANCEYPFPNKLLADLLDACGMSQTSKKILSPDDMSWKIMEHCATQLVDTPEFTELKHYLHGGSSILKRFQLGGKIADTFDQYTLFRSDMLKEWEQGGGEGWQPVLWRKLLEDTGASHRGHLKEEFISRLADGKIQHDRLPARVTVFGISSLPLFHLQVLAGLSSLVEVNMFILSPCRHYWADLKGTKETARQIRKGEGTPEDVHPFLASVGKLGRDFSEIIAAMESFHGGERDLYEASGDERLLCRLQDDILDLLPREGKKPELQGDMSLQVHSCHSPMREVEVLYDRLLDLFESVNGLKPRDVLVMTPDIETYAPYVTAVFGGVQDWRRRIPFSVADRSLKRESDVAKGLLAIIEMAGGRFSAPEVVDLLANPSVSRAFGMTEEDIDVVNDLVRDTRVCWGLDGRDREKFGLPEYSDFSWRAAFDRLLLGYAMPAEDDDLHFGIYPYDAMEGDRAVVLGKLVNFVEVLHAALERLNGVRSLDGWTEIFEEILNGLFKVDKDRQREMDAIGEIIRELAAQGKRSGFSEDVPLEIISAWLKGRLESSGRGFGYLTGGVTFCAMLPMRSVPFSVVALLGMNDGIFPRQDRQLGFNQIALHPQPGDRSLREEDRYLFLEAILSARDVLYMSYTGQSIKDNSELPPSVLVSELLDHLDSKFVLGGKKPSEILVTRHRLQAFSREYFNGSGLFSYSADNLAAAEHRTTAGIDPRRFIETPLLPPPDTMKEVSLESLVRFFANPSKYFAEKRLDLRLGRLQEALEDRELFSLDNLEKAIIGGELLSVLLSGGEPEDLLPVLRASGRIPPGKIGEQEFEALVESTQGVAEQYKLLQTGDNQLDPLDVDLIIDDFTIKGRLSDIWPGGRICCRGSKISGKYLIKGWIEHLVLNLIAPEGYSRITHLVTMDSNVVTLQPLNGGDEHLRILLNLYWEGLKTPLKFFPKTSFEFACTGDIDKAANCWSKTDHYPECDDEYFSLCFGNIDPLDDEFIETATAVFDPYLKNQGATE